MLTIQERNIAIREFLSHCNNWTPSQKRRFTKLVCKQYWIDGRKDIPFSKTLFDKCFDFKGIIDGIPK